MLLALLYLCGGTARAQSTTGTIRGHVNDPQGLPLPGVTVSVSSPNLQGSRTAVTAENGDFVITVLPSGTYSVTFELSGFQRVAQTVGLAPTQDLPIKVELGPADVTEEVTVVGQSAEVLTQTAQVATNFKQELIASLPSNRDINAYLRCSRPVHPSSPNGASRSPARVVRQPVPRERRHGEREPRGQANDLYIEDAVQETTVATAASPPNTGASAAAWSMWSPSRAATPSRDRSARRSSTTSGAR
jgi:hypothetical protein